MRMTRRPKPRNTALPVNGADAPIRSSTSETPNEGEVVQEVSPPKIADRILDLYGTTEKG